jgi:choline-sulfatase
MPERPNFLLIMSDQHHPRVMGCAGDPLVRTPHLDALAESGVRFSSAYCGSPLCVPSRMTFMASRHCSDIDVYTNGCTLASEVPTFAHSLGAAGYEVTLGGRMHFVGPDQRHGFHKRLVGDVSGGLGHIPPVSCGQTRGTVEIYGPGRTGYQAYDDAVLEGCQGYLRERGESPDEAFCLVAGFVLPHCPYIAPKALYDYYYERMTPPHLPDEYLDNVPEPVRSMRQGRGFDELTPEQMRGARAAYYGLVEYFDGLVGRLRESLREVGLADNTIVIYTSDHGDSIGENGWWCKTNFYEGSVGVPLLVSAPGYLHGPIECTANASLLDLGPTMIDYADAAPLPHVAGRSLRLLLQGERPPEWDDTVCAEMVGYGDNPPGRMVKQGPWKLMHYPGYDPLLFNLEDDPEEFVNLADDAELRWLREQLLQRAMAGFDAFRSQGVLAKRAEYGGAIRAWRRQLKAPEGEYWVAPPGVNVWPEE